MQYIVVYTNEDGLEIGPTIYKSDNTETRSAVNGLVAALLNESGVRSVTVYKEEQNI